MSPTARMSVSTLVLTLLISITSAAPARADNYVGAFLGYNFGGDSGCPEITNCEDKNLNWGLTAGSLGGLFGFELEFAHIPDFFGDSPTTSSSVITLMGNFMLAPRFGPVQPYGTVGLGLIKTHAELTSASGLLDEDNNNFGYNTGGGLIITFGQHFGVRGDIRYFHAFDALEILGLNLGGDTKIDYGRFSGGVIVKF
jgi:opacity protein-like surface antigen